MLRSSKDKPRPSPPESALRGKGRNDDNAPSKRVDKAWEYLMGQQGAGHGEDGEIVAATDKELAAIRRKIDWRIIPLCFLCYTMQFLDKVILNYAGVMNIREDLNLVGNDFSNLATFLFVALLVFEVPNGMVQGTLQPFLNCYPKRTPL